jgi:hypothetical protein
MPDTTRVPARKVRFFLRDFRMIDAHAGVAEGTALVPYLTNRKSYALLRDVQWAGTEERAEIAWVRVNQILWAGSPDGDVPVSTASAASHPRSVELQVDGGLVIRGAVGLSNGQRLNDYLESAGPFIPVYGAHLLRSGRPPRAVNVVLGDVALNQDAIQAVWEIAAD